MGVCVSSCSTPSISCPSAHSVLSDARGHHVPTHAGSPRNPDDLTSAGSSRTSKSIWVTHSQIPAKSSSTFHHPQAPILSSIPSAIEGS